jgi:cell division protein FtsN
MEREHHIMFSMFSTLPTDCQRTLRATLALLLASASFLGNRAFGQAATTGQSAAIHAGWQAGPTTLHSERTTAYGAHHLGNTGFGQAVTVQARWNGPWEIEFQGARSQIITDDGYINGLQTEVQSAAVMFNYSLAANETQKATTRNARITRGFQPFIGLGIAHVDHLMKQDLEDALGRTYHLWSDGTLRDIDQAGDHDGNATILRRDYTYESDLAEIEGTQGTGRSLAIPAQIGVRMDISPRVRMRMGVAGWLGLSDAIDHQESGQILSGDALASGFFGLGIRLGKLGKKVAPPPVVPGLTSVDAALLAEMDTDEDGVDNLRDRCPGSPAGVEVNADGCPVDSDGDGYADYRDDEPHSRHTRVDGRGVVIDPLKSLTADWDTVRGQVASDLTDWSGYTLRVPKPEEGWTNAEQQTLLAFTHLKETSEAIEVQVGDDPSEVDEAALALTEQGLEPEIIEPVEPVLTENEDAVVVAAVAASTTEHYRVQLGAFRAPAEEELDMLFAGIDVVRFRGEDGLTRVVSRAFTNRAEADQHKADMEARGFIGAFLTTYADGAPSQQNATETNNEVDTPQFDADKVNFRIQLGALKDQVSTEALNAFLAVGEVEHRAAPGWHRYFQGQYGSVEEARIALPQMQAAGFPDAFVVGEVAGRIVPVAEALILLED